MNSVRLENIHEADFSVNFTFHWKTAFPDAAVSKDVPLAQARAVPCRDDLFCIFQWKVFFVLEPFHFSLEDEKQDIPGLRVKHTPYCLVMPAA